MLAMLKNRLPAIFACGFAAGICANCDQVAGQDIFIQQPSRMDANDKAEGLFPSEPPPEGRQFITRGGQLPKAKPQQAEPPNVKVRQLPPPQSGFYSASSNFKQSSDDGPLGGIQLVSPYEIQWVPRAPEAPSSTRLAQRSNSFTAAREQNNVKFNESTTTQPVTGQLTTWATHQPNQGREHSRELLTAAELTTAPNQNPTKPQLPVGASTTAGQADQVGASNHAELNSAPADQEKIDRKKAWAAMVSAESRERTQIQNTTPLQAVDNPEGWQSIRNRLSEHIRQCQHLLSRRAYYSAREEAQVAIKHLMQMIDLHLGDYQSEPKFAVAMIALREAEDFTYSNAEHGQSTVGVLVGSHSSDVLKQYDLTSVSPLAAGTHYRIYAADKLVEAAQNHPWASELYYTLGRIAQAEAEAASGGLQTNLRWKAVTMYRAAAAINPQNGIALNQLGFIFLQLDRPEDAREALIPAVKLGSTPQAATNLIAASQKLGDHRLLAWAQQRVRPMRPSARPRPAAGVVQVAPSAFVAMNPHVRPRPQPIQPQVQARSVGYQR